LGDPGDRCVPECHGPVGAEHVSVVRVDLPSLTNMFAEAFREPVFCPELRYDPFPGVQPCICHHVSPVTKTSQIRDFSVTFRSFSLTNGDNIPEADRPVAQRGAGNLREAFPWFSPFDRSRREVANALSFDIVKNLCCRRDEKEASDATRRATCRCGVDFWLLLCIFNRTAKCLSLYQTS
jgi:hypothetical protein